MAQLKKGSSSCLFNHDVNLVPVFHLKLFRSVLILDSLTVEDEAALSGLQSLPRAVGLHQLLEQSRTLDLEEDLSPILRLDLDVDVLCTLNLRSRVCFSHLLTSK